MPTQMIYLSAQDAYWNEYGKSDFFFFIKSFFFFFFEGGFFSFPTT